MHISRRQFIATSAASLLVCTGRVSAHNSRPAKMLQLLADYGGNLVDTSPSPRYGRAEAVLGDLCAELNLTDQMFFANKVFSEGEQPDQDTRLRMEAFIDRL
jgi:aryl-alcohol dehydrogenase-like predicted oxidoreductase